MEILSMLFCVILSTIDFTIIVPEHCVSYNQDELPGFKAIVENNNEIPDSVHYSLNGGEIVSVNRLNTDWPTYMQNYQNHGYSDSPAPLDNTILWTAPVTGNAHEFPTPVVVDGIVYYPQDSSGDSLYALDAATGEVIWTYRTGHTDDAVTVCDGYLYTASDSLWCLDSATGEKIWSSSFGDYGGSTPIVEDGRVYCCLAYWTPVKSSTVNCLDSSTGELIWSTDIDGYTVSCMGSANNTVFVPTFNDDISSATLYALDQINGNIIWSNSDSYSGYWDSSPVIADDMIYLNDRVGVARAININTGITEWEVGLTPNHSITATPAFHENRLYFADQWETYHCLDALSGGTIWSVPGCQHGSSGIASETVFYGELDNPNETISVVALDCNTGEVNWSYEVEDTPAIASSPSITDGVVYIAAMDWNLYAFGTGLKYTYFADTLTPEVGWNQICATSFDDGFAVASDTVEFYINPTGIAFEPSARLHLTGSPNPFTLFTSLTFSLNESCYTKIEIYDLSGRCIFDLFEGDLSEGFYNFRWDSIDRNGNRVPPGLYLCRINIGEFSETTGLCLLR